MSLPHLPLRSHLVDLLPSDAVVIELGVAAGAFAVELLKRSPSIRYVGVDRWSDHHNEAEMVAATSAIKEMSLEANLIRATFRQALEGFGVGTADMVYIDGYAHTGQERGETLRDWWPVLKSGGIFAGHDYDPKYSATMKAVDAFTQELQLDFRLTGEKTLPSWYLRKP